ncbi:hypothetical protein CK203_063179 [Vitis vinifera]|uniref:HR-like lesion-inducer n=1 Tax=Vitis vinifera TaxID=29760 RepID=A0A438G4E8_VITVI|nr:hypothetical protein CK203_063179 [Vitis vinifera]
MVGERGLPFSMLLVPFVKPSSILRPDDCITFMNHKVCQVVVMFDEFGVDGGPAAKELIPKFTVIKQHISSKLGLGVPNIDVRNLVATTIVLKGLGGILFVFGSSFGAYLLLLHLAITTPLLYDFYNYELNKPEFHLLLPEFLQSIALFGALLFFLGMKNCIPRRQLKKKIPKTKTV